MEIGKHESQALLVNIYLYVCMPVCSYWEVRLPAHHSTRVTIMENPSRMENGITEGRMRQVWA